MILDSLFNDNKNLILKKMLDYTSVNQRVIAHNIANVETPGFTAKKVLFSRELAEAVRSGDMQRIRQIAPVVVDNQDHPYRMDMNNVDIEHELAKMGENRMQHDLVSSMLKNRLQKWAEIFEKVAAE